MDWCSTDQCWLQKQNRPTIIAAAMRYFVMVIVYRGVDGDDDQYQYDHHVQKTVFLKNSILRDKTVVHKNTFQVNLKI